jgi:5-methylcytosine-specific restriction protein A
MPDYRKDLNTCKWCGKPLKNKRQWSYCCEDCKVKFQGFTVWGRGTCPLPYRILCRDNFICMDCGQHLAYKNEHGMYIPSDTGLEVHHIELVSNGGSDHQSNLITLCKNCHKDRHKIAC